MIKVYNQVPQVYTSTSRDFQYLCWLFDVVLNYSKHNIDCMRDLPNLTSTSAEDKLIELLEMTLGFKIRRSYDKKQLLALVSILPSILKHKGTSYAIMLAGSALLKAAGSDSVFANKNIIVDGHTLTVVLPKDLVDITLFTDLLPYILPAGMTCRVVRNAQGAPSLLSSKFGSKATAHYNSALKDADFGKLHDSKHPLDGSFKFINFEPESEPTSDDSPVDTQNNVFVEDTNRPRFGLLDNNVILNLRTDLRSYIESKGGSL